MKSSGEGRSRGGGFCFSSCFSSQTSDDEGQIIDQTGSNPTAVAAGAGTTQRRSIKRNKVDVVGGNEIIDLAQLAAKNDMSIKSAIIIQRWYRRFKSKKEMQRLTAWHIYQSIEYSGEQNQLKLYDFFLALIRNVSYISDDLANDRKMKLSNQNLKMLNSSKTNSPNDSPSKKAVPPPETTTAAKNAKTIHKIFQTSSSDDISKSKSKQEIVVESSYKGMEIKMPITKQTFHELVNYFKDKKQLHAKYVVLILEETLKVLKTLKNINQISINSSQGFTVVGDLHGSLDDLLLIFYKNALPSDENPYLFNGDFVDRGPKSIEITLIIFCGFLMSSSAVYMNRGNHEDVIMNARYGFLKEICDKYKKHSKRISVLYGEVFQWLPLATLIDNQVYVVHGGISDSTTIKDIASIRRERYTSILKPPFFGDEDDEDIGHESDADLTARGVHLDDVNEWKQILDALWSDPKQTQGVEANVFRGGGCLFGPNITQNVLTKNKLSLIIRSHECKEQGYEFGHGDKLLTVFSASNYYEYGSNKGAYIRLSSVTSKPTIVQFQVKKEGLENMKQASLKEKMSGIEMSAIRHLQDIFIVNKNRLVQAYKQKDTLNKGVMSVNDWCTVTREVLNLSLPWRTLRPKLVKLDKSGLVIYESAFEGLSLPNTIHTLDDAEETIYRHKDILESIFRAIDKDHSGFITKDEFRDCCKLIKQHDNSSMFSEKSIDDIAETLDIDKDGLINLNEFLETFRLVSNKNH